MMCEFDHGQTISHTVVNKSFGVEQDWLFSQRHKLNFFVFVTFFV